MVDPRQNDRAAYKIASVPGNYTTQEHERLFERGLRSRTVNGALNREAQIDAIETAGLCAWKEKVRTGKAKTPLVDDPGPLALDIALAAVCMINHPTFENSDPDHIRGIEYLCDLYTVSIQQLISRLGARSVEQAIAEVIYAKDPDEGIPHPGRVCTGVGPVEAFSDNRVYVEIPTSAASDKALVYITEDSWGAEYDRRDGEVSGALATRVHDNALYVPAAHLFHQHRLYLRNGGFGRLVTSMRETISDRQRKWVTSQATELNDRINRFERARQYEQLYTDWDPDQRSVNLIRDAVFKHEGLESDDPLSPAEIYAAVEDFEPEGTHSERLLKRFHSEPATRRALEDLAEADYIEQESAASETPPTYWIGTNSESLNIGDLEDLFELPCMANMAERLHEEGPVRKDLYSFARMVMWLPQYRDADIDVIVEDLKDVFQRWPWYDEQETDYQVRYEYYNGEIDGEPPLPRNCHNEDLQRYCIGPKACPYHTIYQTLPFPQEMYDHIDTDSSGFSF